MKRLLSAALAVTILFFIEYTNLWRRAHIPFDLEGYHYSLSNAIFLSLKAKQIPLWDSWMYAGIPLAGNIQAALFYPPTWILYATHLPFGRRLPYAAMEGLVIAHIALGFILFYLWLRRGRHLSEIAAIAGGIIFALNGYVCSQITHLGLICTYVWFPLGFWGVDDIALRGQTRRGIVKLAGASALALLAGYPATWACFAVCMGCYAIASRHTARTLLWSAAGMMLSAALCAVQLLPTMEATPLKQYDPKYGWHAGMKDVTYFYSLFVPNFYSYDLGVDIYSNPGKDYWYFGAVGIAGLLLFLVAARRIWKPMLPLFAALAGTCVVMFNPGEWFGRAVERSHTLAQIFSDWYFLAGFVTILSAFAAFGIDHFVRSAARESRAKPAAWLLSIAAFAWSASLLSHWLSLRPFASGWASGIDAAIGTALVIGLLACIRLQGQSRLLTAALVVLALAEYKAFGTSRRVNSIAGPTNTKHSRAGFFGFNSQAWQEIVNSHPLRVTVDEWGPFPPEWRHTGVATVNGFDPFLPLAFQQLVESRKGVFITNRTFVMPRDPEVLRLFGVGFYVTAEASPLYKELMANPAFELYESSMDYFKVFKLRDAKPPYAFPGAVRVERWIPERRRFEIESGEAAVFRLSEQFYPGWFATIDRKPVAVERCEIAFQCVSVPAGKHMLEFVYRPRSLFVGLGITLVALVVLAVCAFQGGKSK
jgi:hypothetical protein